METQLVGLLVVILLLIGCASLGQPALTEIIETETYADDETPNEEAENPPGVETSSTTAKAEATTYPQPMGKQKKTSSSGITAWASLDDLMPSVHVSEGDIDEEPDDDLLKVLYRYSPDAYELARRSISIPQQIMIGDSAVVSTGSHEPFYGYITATDWSTQLVELLVAIHEENHGYTARYGKFWLSQRFDDSHDTMILYENGEGAATPSLNTYFLDRTTSITVHRPYGNIPAKSIAGEIPKELQSDRFETYVLGTSEIGASSTQTQGIFGLLDEYNAYYWTQHVEYDLYDYFRAEMPQNVESWIDYTRRHTNYNSAWAEFRLWILTYLLHVEEHHPEYFQGLMTNHRFREAFTEIDDRFTDLQKRMIIRLIDELPAHLESLGIGSRFEAMTLKIEYTGEDMPDFAIQFNDVSGYPYFINLHEHMRLTREMTALRYTEIANRVRLRPAKVLPPYEFESSNSPTSQFARIDWLHLIHSPVPKKLTVLHNVSRQTQMNHL